MRARILVLLLLLALASSTVSGKAAFSGSYAVNGVNPGTGAYKGTLTIAARGDVYDVHWVIGNLQYWGVGVVVNDTLSVGYSDTSKTWIGVMAYRQRADGALEGKWTVLGRTAKPGTETAVRK